jgi:hypothetical protein
MPPLSPWAFPEYELDGRLCVHSKPQRSRNRYGYYDRVSVHYVAEDGTLVDGENMPFGEFNKRARATGRVRFSSSPGFPVDPAFNVAVSK